MRLICMILTLLYAEINLLQGQNIDSIRIFNSRCPSSGTIIIYASGGNNPLSYSITTGPTTRPPQNSNVFSNLPIGTYSVQVSNPNTVTRNNIIISGNYTNPLLNSNVIHQTCATITDGRITLSASQGRLPYQYELRNGSGTNIIRPIQNSNIFDSLPNGTYQARVYDSCMSITSTTSTINYKTLANSNSYSSNRFRFKCDSIFFRIQVASGDIIMPLQKKYFTNGIDTIHLNLNRSPRLSFDTLRHRFTSSISNIWKYEWRDACGRNGSFSSISMDYYPRPYVSIATLSNGCPGIRLQTAQSNSWTSSSILITNDMVGVGSYFRLTDSLTSTKLSYNNNNVITTIPIGSSYTVCYINPICNDSICRTFSNVNFPDINLSVSTSGKSEHHDSTARIQIVTSNLGSNKKFVIHSGPSAFTDLKGNTYTFNYPDTLTFNSSNSLIFLKSAPPGNYSISAFDNCNNVTPIRNVSVNTSTHLFFYRPNFSATQGCSGNSKINLFWKSLPSAINTYSLNNQRLYKVGEPLGPYLYNTTGSLASTVINNISAGKYVFRGEISAINSKYTDISAQNRNFLSNQSIPLKTYYDTIEVLPYIPPSILQVNGSMCSNTLNQGKGICKVIPNLGTGIQPYQYSIISGPLTRSMKLSDTFINLTQGVYNIQITDACASSSNFNYSLNNFVINPYYNIVSCLNDTVTALELISNLGVFDETKWKHPNRQDSILGPIYNISPITIADTGNYKLFIKSANYTCIDTIVPMHISSILCTALSNCKIIGNATLTKQSLVEISWSLLDNKEFLNKFEIYRFNEITNEFELIKTLYQSYNQLNYKYIDEHTKIINDNFTYKIIGYNLIGKKHESNLIELKNKRNNHFILLPNPASDKVTIQNKKPNQSLTEIQIYDINGKSILKQNFFGKTITLDTCHLSNGIYNILILINGLIEHHKLIISY
jgi:hypothetical protein